MPGHPLPVMFCIRNVTPILDDNILEQDITDFSSTGSIILMGDFNSRTGKYPDTVSQEGNNVITNDQSESAFQPTQRNSFDNVLNSHGKRLLEICKNLDLRIINGRVNGDTLGRPTFHEKNGTSVIDYLISYQSTFLNVTSFVVKQPCYLSDHSATSRGMAKYKHQLTNKRAPNVKFYR